MPESARIPRLVLDWDGTCTVVDTLWLVLEEFGDYDVFKRAGERLMRGEISYRELMETEFSTVKRAALDEVNGFLAREARIRAGFHELVARHDPLVLSSGFEELIRPLLAREDVEVELIANRLDPRPEGWRVRWAREEPCEVCGDWCKRGGLPEGRFVYVGDGYSDRCPALAAERIFARAGLAQYLDREGRPYEPFDSLADVLAALSTERFRRFGPDLANLWHEGGLYRVVGGRDVRIEPAPGGVLVEPLDEEIGYEVGKLLGLEFDLPAFERFARETDPTLTGLVDRFEGYRPPIAPDPFETLVTSITAQQVSLASAFAIRSRMIERLGQPGRVAYAFPTRERLAAAHPDELTAVGFSRRKAEYVIGLAREEIDYDELDRLPDDDVKARLVAVRGLGEWTADWFLARHLARPRAWPAGDLGLRKAAGAFYGDDPLPSIEEVRVLGARFDPFQNLAAHYLLAGLYLSGPAA